MRRLLDPWAEAATRPHITVGFARLPEATGGAVYWPRGDRAAIVLDDRLSVDEACDALAHELLHDELGPEHSPVFLEAERLWLRRRRRV